MQDRYIVKNQFLKDMISRDGKDYFGFTYGKGLGSALLTYFVKRAFNIHRLPFCEDRHFGIDTPIHYQLHTDEKIKNILSKFTPDVIEEITDEVKAIYEFNQKKLSSKETITLTRRVYDENDNSHAGYSGPKYASKLFQIKKYAEQVNLQTINVEMDILNSFTNKTNYYQLYPVTISIKVPVQDIFYCAKYMGKYDDDITEEGEYVVINRDSRGLSSIPVSSITINSKLESKIELYKYSDKHTREILQDTLPFRLHNNFSNIKNYNKLNYRIPSFQERIAILKMLINPYSRYKDLNIFIDEDLQL